ncbi:hypothetical protein HNP60_003820 [Sphingobium sp. B1D3A]|uniref:Conjugal transfer protein TrbI n=1 Tax=Sphingobium lignivorans TaxID=2735886 RepID=A0ABR6NL41_9SPHN|nr:hypothetical protein [Sphingobium lignivorans]
MTDTIASDPPIAAPKVDPETLSIRSRPARAIRFKRGAIIGAAALGSASLMGIAWMALKPQVFRQVAQDSELSQPMASRRRMRCRDCRPAMAMRRSSGRHCRVILGDRSYVRRSGPKRPVRPRRSIPRPPHASSVLPI